MSKRNRVLAVILVAVLMLTAFMVPEKASGVGAALTAADLWMSAWAAYCASHGMANTFISGSSPSNASNPISSANVNDLVDDLITRYANANNLSLSLSSWAQALGSSVSVTASNDLDTVLHVAAAEVGMFDAFADWLLTDMGLTRTASGFAHSGGSFGSTSVLPSAWANGQLPVNGSKLFVMQNSSYTRSYALALNSTQSGQPVYAFAVDDGSNTVGMGAVSVGNFTALAYANTSYSTVSVTNGNGIYYSYNTYGRGTNLQINGSINTFGSLAAALEAFGGGSISLEKAKMDLGATDVNAGVIGIPDVDDQDYAPDTISVPLNQTWDDAYAGSSGLVDALTDIMDKVRSNTIALAGEGTDNSGGGSGSSDPDDFQALGLGDVFPFCLPFDLYDFFSCLAADPVAPRFQIPINFPRLNITYTFDLDLSAFDSVAAVLRKMELLGFCVALILVSRQKFLRG